MSYYRIHLRVAPAYLERIRRSHPERTQPALLADVEGRVRRLGAQDVLTIMQDPTMPTQLTVIGAWCAPPQAGLGDDVVQVIRAEPVEAPPATLTRQKTRIAWDHGLSSDEWNMIENALLNERNPRHLRGIAATMEPYFPAAASVLDAKGDLVENKILVDRSAARDLERAVADYNLSAEQRRLIAEQRARLEAFASRMQIPEMVVREEVKRTASSLVDPNATPSATFPAGVPLATLLPRTVFVQGRPLNIVCPHALAEAFPPVPEDGALNETSVQLALAASKPKMSLIAAESQVPGRMRQIGRIPVVGLDVRRPLTVMERKYLRARAHMERANQAIERRRWVDWYRRRERAFGNQLSAFSGRG